MSRYDSRWTFVFERVRDDDNPHDLGQDYVHFSTNGVSIVDATALAWLEVERRYGKRQYSRELASVTREGDG